MKTITIYIFMILLIDGCKQVEGPQGNNSLIDIKDEPAGSNCSTGGYKILTGIDLNNNNILDENEIQNTKYICNGDNGLNGLNTLLSIVAEKPGANCPVGGYKVSTGIDLNNNDTLEDSEIQHTEFLCNGNSGYNSLISAIPEPPGKNCESGGYLINAGNDLNNNDTLDANEIESSIYLCNGQNAVNSSENQVSKIDGFVQKGPFINGTAISISELDSNLYLTGRIFTTQITDNTGSFEVNHLDLASDYVSLRADGFYYNEITGEQSASQISLFAISDIKDKSTINVNSLSDLEKARVEYLVSNGTSFTDAKREAQSDVLGIFNIRKDSLQSSEELDISKAGDDNAILLAVSLILQGFRSEGELTELFSGISNDIKEDGTLDNTTLGSELINHAVYLDTASIRHNLEQRYAELGVNASIPDFEYYITNFINNTNFPITATVIGYPVNGLYGPNILDLNKASYTGTDFSLAATLPKGTTLKIRITALDGGIWGYALGSETNWSITTFDSGTNSQDFTAISSGTSCDLHMVNFNTGSYQIDYFEKGSSNPTRSKTITF